MHHLFHFGHTFKCNSPDWSLSHTSFEAIYSRPTPQHHMLSFLYTLLFPHSSLKPTKMCHKWEKQLDLSLTEEEWDRILHHIHKGSINVMTQEAGYTLLSGLHRTPLLIHKFTTTASSLCWRCEPDPGSLLHLWWSCTKIQPFWSMIHADITKITSYTLDYTPAQYFLHHSSLPKSVYHKSLALHLVNAARLRISVCWNSISTQTHAEWYHHICQTTEMEELISVARMTPLNWYACGHAGSTSKSRYMSINHNLLPGQCWTWDRSSKA